MPELWKMSGTFWPICKSCDKLKYLGIGAADESPSLFPNVQRSCS